MLILGEICFSNFSQGLSVVHLLKQLVWIFADLGCLVPVAEGIVGVLTTRTCRNITMVDTPFLALFVVGLLSVALGLFVKFSLSASFTRTGHSSSILMSRRRGSIRSYV